MAQINLPSIKLGGNFLPLLKPNQPKFTLVEGPRGTAKTRSILSIELLYALDNPGARVLLSRSTRTRLSESVMATLEEQVFPAFGMAVPGGSISRQHRTKYSLSNGSEFLLMALDDPQRSTSLEVARIYVSEGVEIARREMVESLAGSLRQAGMPNRCCIVDSNPEHPGHWLNQAAEPVAAGFRKCYRVEDYRRLMTHAAAPPPAGRWKRIVTKMADNPGYFNTKTWTMTDAGREYYDDTLKSLTGHLRRRWLDGDWVAASGGVFPEFDEEAHVILPFPNGIPKTWPCWWLHDAGYQHPATCLLVTIAPNERVYLANEWHGGGKRVAEHADWIKKQNNTHGYYVKDYLADPRDCFKRTESGPSIADQFKVLGLKFHRYPQKQGAEVQSQVEALRTLLTTKGADGLPMFQIFNTCVGTIGEFQSWKYKQTSTGDAPEGDDRYEDRNNNAIDPLLGFFAMGHKHRQAKLTVINPGEPVTQNKSDIDQLRARMAETLQ